MGAKSSRPTVGTDVYYTFRSVDSKDLIVKLTKMLMKGSLFALKSLEGWSPQCDTGGGPVLVVRECPPHPSHQMTQLIQESHCLGPNELMVVLTSEVTSRYSDTSEAMVQLQVKGKGKNKTIDSSLEANKRNIGAIESFLARRTRETRPPYRQNSISSSNSRSQYETWASPSLTTSAAEAATAKATAATKAAAAAAAAAAAVANDTATKPVVPFSSPVSSSTIVHMAFGDQAEDLLRNAVRFVETECKICLVESQNLEESHPLLVFCKNSTKLQEDIRHATENTREGQDVMLLVITDRKELVLRDTQATENLGAKDCLLYDQVKCKFSFKDNKPTLIWIKKFLARHHIAVSLKLNRTDSLRQSWNKLRKSEEMGWYLVRGNLSEEEEKSIVLFFEDLQVGLTETDISHPRSPLVVLCAASQNPDRKFLEYRKQHPDVRDAAFLVIVHRSSENVPDFRALQDDHADHGKLATGDLSARVEDSAQNRKLVDAVRKFLRRSTAPSLRGRPPEASCPGDESTRESSRMISPTSAPACSGSENRRGEVPLSRQGGGGSGVVESMDSNTTTTTLTNAASTDVDFITPRGPLPEAMAGCGESEPPRLPLLSSILSHQHASPQPVTLTQFATLSGDRPAPREEGQTWSSSSAKHPFRPPQLQHSLQPPQPHPHPPHSHPHHFRQPSTPSQVSSQSSWGSDIFSFNHHHQQQQQQHQQQQMLGASSGHTAADLQNDPFLDSLRSGEAHNGDGQDDGDDDGTASSAMSLEVMGGGGGEGRSAFSSSSHHGSSSAASQNVGGAHFPPPSSSSSSSSRHRGSFSQDSWARRRRHQRMSLPQVTMQQVTAHMVSPGGVSQPGDTWTSAPSPRRLSPPSSAASGSELGTYI